MSNYTMPPRLRASDYAKGKISQDEIIALQIANDANIAKARKALKMGEIQQPTPAQVASPDELIADVASQEAAARSNLERLGFRPQEAAQIVTNIRIDPTLDFVSLNANFPAIEADIKKRFNVKLLTPTFFLDYFRKYSQELEGTTGMKVFDTGVNGLVNTIGELREVLPSKEQMYRLLQKAEQIRRQTGQGKLLDPIMNRLQALEQSIPSEVEYDRIERLNNVARDRIIQEIIRATQDLPSLGQIERAIRGNRQDFENVANSIPDGVDRKLDDILKDGFESKEEDPRTTQERVNEERDRKAAESALRNGIDPRTLTPKQRAIYFHLSGVVAPTLEQLSDLTGDTATTTETLTSSISLDGAALKQIKNTIKLYPEIAERLINLATGEKVNYNDLTLTRPTSAKSRKVFFEDTNLRELLRTKFGRGIMKSITPNIKMKVGRGLAVKQTPSYREYGKYAIHIPQLEQQDILNVKYKSLGQIPKFKPIPVSDVFRDFILDLLENGKPNARVYTQIAPEERKFFEEMSIGAGVWNGLGLKRTTTSTDEEENKRFEILRGEYMAGNNNPKVISELRKLVVKMMNDGRIRKNQGVELLMELSI